MCINRVTDDFPGFKTSPTISYYGAVNVYINLFI